MSPKLIRRGSILRGKRVERLIRKRLEKSLDLEAMERRMQALKRPGLALPAANASLKRLPHLFDELADFLRVDHLARRQSHYVHLFPNKGQARPGRVLSKRLLNELNDLAGSPEFRSFLSDSGNFRKVERAAGDLLQSIANTVDRYSEMTVETRLFNKLITQLYPNEYDTLLVDAHHFIEKRAFAPFKDTWLRLGWQSTNDMPAIPLMARYHRRTPKNLPGVAGLAIEKDIISLTDELERTINLSKIDSPIILIRNYRDFYRRRTQIGDAVDPALAMIEIAVKQAK